jgi:hypothetical protein
MKNQDTIYDRIKRKIIDNIEKESMLTMYSQTVNKQNKYKKPMIKYKREKPVSDYFSYPLARNLLF